MSLMSLISWALVLGTVIQGAPTTDRVLTDLISLIEKELHFFAEDYSNINVDGLFGLRIAQGQLKKTIEECGDGHCDHDLLAKVVSMDTRLEDTCSKALPYVIQVDAAYFNRFEETITKPYIMDYHQEEFDLDPVHTGKKNDYNEEFGDECYGRVMGTYMENDVHLPKCNVTHACWDYMTQHETSDYSITHQLLYFIIIGHVGCQEDVEQQMHGKSLREIQTRLCRNIYEESKHLSRDGYVDAFHQDLFLEQTVLCGPLGFEDFMRPDWMKMVMSWPDKQHGCFKLTVPELFKPFMVYNGMERREAANTNDRAIESAAGDPYSSNRSTMRKVLREKAMTGPSLPPVILPSPLRVIDPWFRDGLPCVFSSTDGCLSHTSGLGFGAMCTYLRYIVKYI